MPHIKTFLRYAGQRLAWTLLTSHNLSKAAWGRVQKKGKPDEHFQIDSYELGVRTRTSNNPCVPTTLRQADHHSPLHSLTTCHQNVAEVGSA